ncbi:hypothetical protein FRC05_003500 [Tulasnella sp. 425]|nr:hypothetical protein FRC05_003500 [Tulasnella sp. 425]
MPFEQHGMNTENRQSAASNPMIHQDPAESNFPNHAQETEVDMLSDLNNKDHCCRFIRYIRRVALDKGKSNNKEWMAKYAETRLEDDAMFWHIELDDDTRSNWDKLCRAILVRAGGANTNSPTAFRLASLLISWVAPD